VAYHEAGHALASMLGGSDEQVHKISIIPRGLSALGYTMQLPSRDRYLITRSELHTKLIGLLGGRAAEQLVFGEGSTGARNDLKTATELARAMVTEYGMSDAVGPVSVAPDRTSPFLTGAAGLGLPHDGGDKLANTVDAEIRRLVDQAYEAALKLLREHQAALEQLATRLIEVEQLEGQELANLLLDARAGQPRDSAPQPALMGNTSVATAEE